MPRHNRDPRRAARRVPTEFAEKPPTYEDLARDLVKRGICSDQILEQPYQWKKDKTS